MEREPKEKHELWRTYKGKDGTLRWKQFGLYDTETALKELQPEEKAHNFAGGEMGEKSGDDLTLEEREMLGGINDHIGQLRDWYLRTAGYIKDEVNEIAQSPDLDSMFAAIFERFRAAAKRRQVDFVHTQDGLLRDHRAARRELIAFQMKNRLLDRTAHYPESRLLHIAIVFALIAGEGVMNASFFPQDLGLIGGFVTAVLVSVGNVALSFMTGVLFLRLLSHISPLKKTLGLVGFAISLLVIGFIHLTGTSRLRGARETST